MPPVGTHPLSRGMRVPLVAAAAVAALLVSSPVALAATPTVQAALTISSSSVTAGTSVQLVATATNLTASALTASFGINVPSPLHASAVSGTAGCHPRNTGRLVYCGVQSLGPHASATITITLTAASSGTYSFRSYARQTYLTNDTFAYVTLTVH